MRARLLLEPQVAAEAAAHADKSDVVKLRSKVAGGRAARDRAECEQADDAFHRAVAETSRNPVLIGFLIYLSGARGVCQTCCPPISCGVSDFRGADFGFWVEPDGSGGLPVAGFA
jgi:hypothetical protein